MKSTNPVSEYLHTRCSVYFQSSNIPEEIFSGFGAAVAYLGQHLDIVRTADIQVHTGDMVEPFYQGDELLPFLTGAAGPAKPLLRRKRRSMRAR